MRSAEGRFEEDEVRRLIRAAVGTEARGDYAGAADDGAAQCLRRDNSGSALVMNI